MPPVLYTTMLVLLTWLSVNPAFADERQETYFGNRDQVGQYAYRGRVPSEVELAMYRNQSPTSCEGAHADQAVEVALSHHWKWVVLYNIKGTGDQQTRRAFDDSWQALRYLVDDLNCKDPLVRYRYGNNKHMQRDYESSAGVFSGAVTGVRKHYPRMLPMVLGQYAEALAVNGDSEGAIARHRQILELVPDDVSAVLNLAGRLSRRGEPRDVEEARELLRKARNLGVSDHGDQVIRNIESRLEGK